VLAMPLPAIKVQGLWKEYSIGGRQRGNETFREMIVRALSVPFHHRAENAQPDHELFWALRDINFEVQPGEVVGVIGNNGAGKSTLLKILTRITEPTRGEITILGRVASLLEIGTGFHPELTGRENIYLNGAILGMSRADILRRFDEIVAFAEIEKFLDTPVKRYSSGMYLRLAFAVAAHLESEVLVVDEVLAVGDVAFQKKCLQKMGDVANTGRTVLFVSHQLAAITNLCKTAMVLQNGRVISSGPTASVVQQYLIETAVSSPGSISRPSWAEPLIQSVRTVGAGGLTQHNFPLGGEVQIEMTVRLPAARRIAAPIMGVVISHPLFGIVGGINTRMTGYRVSPVEGGDLQLFCKLRGISLLPGRYTADVWFGDGPIDLDVAQAAIEFAIDATDVYGTGQLPLHQLGVIFFRADWGVTRNLPEIQ
jgi:lipopolysaccharide transport system ATP-binding protein